MNGKRSDWWKAIAGLAVVALLAVGLGLLFRGQRPAPVATGPTATATAQPPVTQEVAATPTTMIVPTGTAPASTPVPGLVPTEIAPPEPTTSLPGLDDYLFGEPQVVLTNPRRYIGIAGWLPDSEHLLITRGDPERPLREFIETFNVRTGDVRRLGERDSLSVKPLWLPAMQEVAYTDWVGKEYRALYTSRGETAERQTIATKLSSLHIGADPRGQQIVFFTEAAGERPQLWDVQRETVQSLPFILAPLAYTTGPMMPSPYLIAWHPSEDKVAFYNNYHFFMADLNTGRMPEVDLGDWNGLELWAMEAQWSPDGRYLALLVTVGDLPVPFVDLAVLDTDTGKFHMLDRDPQDKNISLSDVAWAPDSQHLLILGELTWQEREAEDVSSHLYLVDALTGKFRPILSNHALGGGDGGWNLAWSPDGQRLAVNCPTSEEGRLCVIAVTAP